MHQIAAVFGAIPVAASAAQAPAPPAVAPSGQETQAPAAQAAPAVKEEKRVCRKEAPTGTRLTRRTVCLSRKEGDRMANESRREINDTLSSSSSGSMEDPN